MMKYSHLKIKIAGYTLVETLVAISIFSLSILGLLSALSQGVADTSYAKKKVAASYLAEEGIEYFRNMRDTFMVYDPSGNPSAGWSEFLSHVDVCRTDADGCWFDPGSVDYDLADLPMASLAVAGCIGDCEELRYDESTGSYGYDPLGAPSGFIRKIKVESITINEIKVTSTVSWKQGSGPFSAEFSESLFNWIE